MLPLITRKERWGLSGRGWLVLVVVALATSSFFFFTIGPFLAVTDRVVSDTLVVEGWISLPLQRAAAEEFAAGGRYHRLFTTGGPWSPDLAEEDNRKTWASIGAKHLKAAGVPEGIVRAVPSGRAGRDRTYASAVALREWGRANDAHFARINVVTEGVHARRTRLLFAEAFGPEVAVGIVALPSPEYDLKRWWLSSAGVRDVVGETLAYLYARLVFSPTSLESPDPD